MTLIELRNTFERSLVNQYPKEEIHSFFQLLAHHFLGYSRFEVNQHRSDELQEEQLSSFTEALERLKADEPIQYIIGETEFYSLPFQVTSATLIPRPETEELVDWILEDARVSDYPVQTVLDVGTGTGCIAIALASHLEDSEVSAIDISAEALHIAKKNAVRNGVAVEFVQRDILQSNALPQSYDVIVSNPPYVRESEKQQMHANVLNNEPASALFVADEDPLVFYRKITQLARNHLNQGGALYFEINEYLSEEMKALVTAEGFKSITLKKDIHGKLRMLRCRKK